MPARSTSARKRKVQELSSADDSDSEKVVVRRVKRVRRASALILQHCTATKGDAKTCQTELCKSLGEENVSLLRSLAKKLDVPQYSCMRKEQLCEAISNRIDLYFGLRDFIRNQKILREALMRIKDAEFDSQSLLNVAAYLLDRYNAILELATAPTGGGADQRLKAASLIATANGVIASLGDYIVHSAAEKKRLFAKSGIGRRASAEKEEIEIHCEFPRKTARETKECLTTLCERLRTEPASEIRSLAHRIGVAQSDCLAKEQLCEAVDKQIKTYYVLKDFIAATDRVRESVLALRGRPVLPGKSEQKYTENLAFFILFLIEKYNEMFDLVSTTRAMPLAKRNEKLVNTANETVGQANVFFKGIGGSFIDPAMLRNAPAKK